MHARIAVYKFKPGTREAVYRKAEAELVPVLRTLAGFHGYEVVLTDGPDALVSVSRWDTEAQAKDAVAAAKDWVSRNVSDSVLSADNWTGPVVVSQSA